jgi:hypothetical protein
MAVLIPITSPSGLISGPPLLPASVCGKSSRRAIPGPRPFALMMPAVTVPFVKSAFQSCVSPDSSVDQIHGCYEETMRNAGLLLVESVGNLLAADVAQRALTAC